MTDTHLHTDASVPVARRRPTLDRWLRDHDMDYAEGGAFFGVSKQTCHDWCRHFDDPCRKVPSRAKLTLIVRKTSASVRPEDFSPSAEEIMRGLAA